jgi:Family of unknown function (DUF6065)
MQPCAHFYRLIEDARLPQRADRSAAGTLPTRASRYCDAVTSASGYGWWVFPPMNFSLYWDGHDVYWTYEGQQSWLPLSAAQFPHFRRCFDEAAPNAIKGYAPPFLTALPEPGVVQVWTGLIARTAPEWSLLVRPVANMPRTGGYELYEGIVETDRWFGPLFINLRLTKTDTPIRVAADLPFIQVQPLPRIAYADETLSAVSLSPEMAALTDDDWNDYFETVVRPNIDPDRPLGEYAVRVRKRRKSGCPRAAAVAAMA